MHWPKDHFATPDAPFEICVLGQDPFGERLDVVAEGQKLSGQPVLVRRLQRVEEATECESLFIGESEQLRLQAMFGALAGKPVLTVGDLPNFVIRGGMVQFYPRGNKIRLMLDPEAFSENSLKPSAHLMRIVKLAKRH